METKKIALACFIGGVICGAVALAVAPAIWWLGILAGFAGGYVSYEFREVRRAVPVALQKAGQGISGEVLVVWRELTEFFSRPHPFGYSAILTYFAVVSGLFTYTQKGNEFAGKIISSFGEDPVATLVIGLFFGGCFLALLPIMFFTLTLTLVAQFGTEPYGVCNWTAKREKVETLEDGRKIVLLTYTNAFRWIARGVGEITLFFVWRAWKYLAVGIWTAFVFLARFAWHLFKLIHSEKRLLCGVDGAIGGAASYLWVSSAANPILVVLFGGLLGAAFGVLNWEIVSKRLLKVEVH